MAITADKSDFSDLNKTQAAPAASEVVETANANINAYGQTQPQSQPQNQAQPQAGAQQGWAAEAQPQAQPYPQYEPAGLLAYANQYDVPFNSINGKIQAFLNAFTEVSKDIPRLARNQDSWEILTFDGPSNESAVSCLLYVRRGGPHAVVYAFLIQESMEQLPDRQYTTQTYNGEQVTVMVPQITEELFIGDTTLSQRIGQYVLNSYAGKGVIKHVHVIAALNLPPELDPVNKQQLSRILFYANEATESALAILGKTYRPFSLRDKKPDEILRLSYDYNQGQVATAAGLPVRSDLAIRLYVQKDRKQNANQLGYVGNQLFSIANGYMTLMYTGQQVSPMAGMMPYGQPQLNPMFQPAFVINRLENQFGGATLETQLLALATVANLNNNGMWMSLYRPNYAITEPLQDPKDIGNLTVIANYPGENLCYTNTKEQGFNMAYYLAKYLHQGLMFFMDIPELGELNYLQRNFLQAAGISSRPEDAAEANRRILDAANVVTCGILSKYYPNNDPVVINDIGRIEQGYFVNERGEMRDLSEIDALSLVVRTNADTNVVNDFIDSFNPRLGDEIGRFARRKRIYDTYFSGYQIRGYARRLTIRPEFLTALGRALAEAGGVIHVEQNFHVGQTVDRGYHNQALVLAPNAVAGYVQGYSTGGFNGQQNVLWRNYVAPQGVQYNYGVTQPQSYFK